jgi:DNA-binding IclR family transcriptional regulator
MGLCSIFRDFMASLENAAIILRLINSLNRKVTVTDLVEHAAMPKSSASRLLAQMKDHGLLDRDDSTRAYGPSVMFLELSRLVRATSLSTRMQEALKRLSARSGHTGYISVLDGRDVLVLHVQPGSQPLRLTTFPGHRTPCWGTSTGRALLALDSDEAVMARLGHDLPYVCERVPATMDDLLARLAQVRQVRHAVAVNESIPGVASVSCAISDPSTRERLALCLSFPAAEAQAGTIDELASELLAEASSLGRAVCDPAWGSPVQIHNES